MDAATTTDYPLNDEENVCNVPFIGHIINAYPSMPEVILDAYYSQVPQPVDNSKPFASFPAELKWRNEPYQIGIFGAYPFMTQWEVLDYKMEHIEDEHFIAYSREIVFTYLKEFAKGFQKGYDSFTNDIVNDPQLLSASELSKAQVITDFISNPFRRFGFSEQHGTSQRSTTPEDAADNKLGDFTDRNVKGTGAGQSSDNDYSYDANGNMLTDLNKKIKKGGLPGIVYSHLNLAYQVFFWNGNTANDEKGTVTYIYDAAGNKLEKRVKELHAGVNHDQQKTTMTSYIGNYVYENNSLQFFSHEEGRVRVSGITFSSPQCTAGGGPISCNVDEQGNIVDCHQGTNGSIPLPAGCNAAQHSYVYSLDYYIKDHLGNVRTTLTDEKRIDAYPVASMETAQAGLEKNYYTKIEETTYPISQIPGYPEDDYTYPNENVSKLNGNTQKLGPGIVLKVMAGDKFNLRVNSWYKTNDGHLEWPDATNPLIEIATNLAGGIGGIPGAHATTAQLQDGNVLMPALESFFDRKDSYTTLSRPLAYVNWILLDEQFKFVAGSSGAQQVLYDDEFSTLWRDNLPLEKNGYLYVYVSNETPNVNVYFDNLQVTHIRGPLVEESQYYPFGLSMAGIGSKAVQYGGPVNRNKYNGMELQSKEMSDGIGLDMYDYGARMYNPQIGRWHNPDPLSEQSRKMSIFSYAFNNPLRFVDPDGMESEQVNDPERLVNTITVMNTRTGELTTYITGYAEEGAVEMSVTGLNGGKGVHFRSGDEAAIAWSLENMQYTKLTSPLQNEHAGTIYSENNRTTFSYNGSFEGTEGRSDYHENERPKGSIIEGFIHTHSNLEHFSSVTNYGGDIPKVGRRLDWDVMVGDDKLHVDFYLINPSTDLTVSRAAPFLNSARDPDRGAEIPLVSKLGGSNTFFYLNSFLDRNRQKITTTPEYVKEYLKTHSIKK